MRESLIGSNREIHSCIAAAVAKKRPEWNRRGHWSRSRNGDAPSGELRKISRNKEDIKRAREPCVALPFNSLPRVWSRRSTCRPSSGAWLFVARSRVARLFRGGFQNSAARRPEKRARSRPTFGQNSPSERRKKRACNYRETPPPTLPATPANRSMSILAPFFRRTIRIEQSRGEVKKLTN